MKTINPTQMMILIAALFLMSCGAHKEESGTFDESSRIIDTTQNTGPKVIAYCNQAMAENNTYRVNVAAHLDHRGIVDPNHVHVKITQVPDSFTADTGYFALWKWYAETSGYTYVDQTPLSFKLVRIQTGEDLTGYIQTMKWSTVKDIAEAIGATTPAQFFHKVRLFVFLNDANAQYDVLTVTMHEASTGAAQVRADALIPLFYANPIHYAENRAKVLTDIHPFANMAYQGWTSGTFTTKSNEFCTPFQQY